MCVCIYTYITDAQEHDYQSEQCPKLGLGCSLGFRLGFSFDTQPHDEEREQCPKRHGSRGLLTPDKHVEDKEYAEDNPGVEHCCLYTHIHILCIYMCVCVYIYL